MLAGDSVTSQQRIEVYQPEVEVYVNLNSHPRGAKSLVIGLENGIY